MENLGALSLSFGRALSVCLTGSRISGVFQTERERERDKATLVLVTKQWHISVSLCVPAHHLSVMSSRSCITLISRKLSRRAMKSATVPRLLPVINLINVLIMNGVCRRSDGQASSSRSGFSGSYHSLPELELNPEFNPSILQLSKHPMIDRISRLIYLYHTHCLEQIYRKS